MKLSLTILLIAILLSSFIYSQTAKTQRYNPFSGTVVFSVEGGTTLASTDYSGLGVDYLGRLSLEYFFPAWIQSGFGLRVFGNAGFLRGSDSSLDPIEFRTNISSIGAGVIFDLSINDVVFPYFFAGIASLTFNPKGEGGVELPNNASGIYKTTEASYLAELGLRYPVTENLSLSFNIGAQISPNDWFDDQAIGISNDMFFTVMGGISDSFLTEFDSDGDGVADYLDQCPATP